MTTRGATHPRLLQSAGLRFAALFTVVFAASSLALVAVLWWATAGALDRQLAAAIRAGTLDDDPGLLPRLRQRARERLAVSNPRAL
ncbi:MAG: hypothetical protein EBY30_02595 [Rhodospirillales bacterium]|nr:hypothetical protein [Rhodospirillales bacterium]